LTEIIDATKFLRFRSSLPEEWKDYAECRHHDPELFFFDDSHGFQWTPEYAAQKKEAEAVCASCSVRQECFEYAVLGHEKYGIWGGVTFSGRRHARADYGRGKWKPSRLLEFKPPG